MPVLLYPVYLVKFWYVDATRFFLHMYREIFSYCISLFSFPLLFYTFFKPIKNEYRKDLILFSICFGMAVKSFLIAVSVGIMLLLFAVGVALLLAFWAFPYLVYQLLSL